jgi:uncharacterized membrane protein YobD (UPF0266 family)
MLWFRSSAIVPNAVGRAVLNFKRVENGRVGAVIFVRVLVVSVNG